MDTLDGSAFTGSIRAKRATGVLTGLGIAVGVAAVILLTSMGEGLQRFVLAEFTQFGTNLVSISPGKVTTFSASLGVIGSRRLLTIEDGESLRRLPRVEAVVPVVQNMPRSRPATAPGGSRSTAWVRRWTGPSACACRAAASCRRTTRARPGPTWSLAAGCARNCSRAATPWVSGCRSATCPCG